MSSLRRRLTVWLWLGLAAVGIACAGLVYWQSSTNEDEQLDFQMQQIAHIVVAESSSTALPVVISSLLDLDRDGDEDIIVTVRDASDRVLFASRVDAPLPPVEWVGLRTIDFGGDQYRMLSVRSDSRHITVGQELENRRDKSITAVWTSLLPVVVLIPVLGLVIALVIRNVLQPLRMTAAEISARPPMALDPLSVNRLPGEVRPLVEAMNRLFFRLRSAIQREQQFLADAAHALRTPLAALQLQSDVLEGSRDPAETAIRHRELRAGIRRAVRLANHLLALARNEPAGASIPGQADLSTALREAHELYLPTAGARQVTLELDIQSNMIVSGGARQLALVLGNLIDNAVRHTPRGGQVIVSAVPDDAGVRLEVLDEGHGLPESELEKVFERFHRVPGDTTEGSGLGLAVVRDVVESLGGRVQLQNRADRTGLVARVWLSVENPLREDPSLLRR